jgi:thiazole synthase ThiGH ThiG subunit
MEGRKEATMLKKDKKDVVEKAVLLVKRVPTDEEMVEEYEVIKTRNTLSPEVGWMLTAMDAEALIEEGFTVNISKARG